MKAKPKTARSSNTETVLAQGAGGITERVTLSGSGPFVRKKIPRTIANRAIWAALSDCDSPRLPHIALTYDMPDHFVVVYDYTPGKTLEEIASASNGIEEGRAVELLSGICDAVATLHEHGIIRCDLSPYNIIVAADGAHLIDFGISQMRGAKHTGTTTPLGTWGFAAPEQYGFAEVSERSDVYSLACLLGYMLSGELPGKESVGPAHFSHDKITAPLLEVIDKGSAFEPSSRYANALELSKAAEAAHKGIPFASEASDDASRQSDLTKRGQEDRSCASAAPQYTPKETEQGTARQRKMTKGNRKDGSAKSIPLPAMIAAIVVAVVIVFFSVNYLVFHNALSPDSTMQNTTSDNSNDGLASDTASPSTVNAHSSSASSDTKADLSIVESGYNDDDGYIHYGIALKNNDESCYTTYPTIRIVGKDDQGKIVFSEDQVLGLIGPGETIVFGCQAGNGVSASTVDFSVETSSVSETRETDKKGEKYVFTNQSVHKDSIGNASFTGEVEKQNADEAIEPSDTAAVSLILRDESGSIVGGYIDFVTLNADGAKTAFELSVYDPPAFASYELHALSW